MPIWQSGSVAPESAPLLVAMETTSAPLGIPSYGLLPAFPILCLGAVSENAGRSLEGLSKCGVVGLVSRADTRQGQTSQASPLIDLFTALTPSQV